jgi:exodeoxyribonuclease VII large subunit
VAKKPLQTQWEFGKPAATTQLPTTDRRVFSVAELTSKVRTALEKDVGYAWVTGEISNFRLQSSGHVYFTLKDQYAQLACVLFKADARSIDRALLKDGQTIIVHGEMTVYESRGQYQLRIVNVEFQGAGKLQAAFEKLKQKLNAEGLFAKERKRPIPKFPRRIGLITSVDGAALHDVLHVIERRQPALEIYFVPCRVQGLDASREIALALKTLNEWREPKLDLILLTRGGGSLEDLWAFNEETTARAIIASKLPVISAVGHEIDFTISDFAADLRAATPSAAAELITDGAVKSHEFLIENQARLQRTFRDQISWRVDELNILARTLERRQPMRILRERQQRLDDLSEALKSALMTRLQEARSSYRQLHQQLATIRLGERIRREITAQDQLKRRLYHATHNAFKRAQQRSQSIENQLRLLGPQQTLRRGYSITVHTKTNEIIRSPEQVETGEEITTRLAEGQIHSRKV